MLRKPNKKGFTILEIILSITLLGTIITLGALGYRDSQVRADINLEAANMVHYLRLAQSAAASGLNDSDQGIHLESDSYTLFEGGSYNEENPENFEIELPATIAIEEINLHGTDNDIVFEKGNGKTDNYGTFSMNSTEIDRGFTITITPVGTINY